MSLKRVLFFIMPVMLIILSFSLTAQTTERVTYRAYVASIGWFPWVYEGQTAGSIEGNDRIEAVQFQLVNPVPGFSIQYRAHVSNIGWQSWASDGQIAGTIGDKKKLEALEMILVNAPDNLRAKYRIHVATSGWLPWMYDGETAGSITHPKRMEGVELRFISRYDCSTPTYAPDFWNNTSLIKGNNNCYNYSNNRRTDTFAQPGNAGGQIIQALTCEAVTTGAILDGLEPTTATAPTNGKTKIALVIWPDYDYHWYRLDSNGLWSHKPGGTAATNLDNSGSLITNPETADRGNYTIFCGYFLTCSNLNQGEGQANIR